MALPDARKADRAPWRPSLWINLQQAWDMERAQVALADQLANIPTLEAAA